MAWLNHSGFWPVTFAFAPWVLFLFALYGFVYWLNQRAVRRTLEPRSQELLALLASLEDEIADQDASPTDITNVKNSGVLEQTLLVTGLSIVMIAFMFFADNLFQSQVVPILKPYRGTPASFADLIADKREEKNLVGLAALITVDGKVVASAASGERKWASGVMIELGDQWHIGGITASITATMIARLIESGQLQWTTTIGECFPDAKIHEDWKSVTFQELLSHTAGAPPLLPAEDLAKKPSLGPECTLARREAVLKVLANKPDNPPGEKYVYSNVDSTIAAAMAEKKTGVTWEDLVKREVFEPLGLKSAGFGPPKSPDESLPEPRGHRPYLGSKIPANDTMDNTNLMAPSGAVHMSLADLSTYANEHLRGQLGEGKLLSAETYQRLHTPLANDYSFGWRRKEPSKEIPYTTYSHNGSNTLWYALVVFIPEKNMVAAVASNDGDWPSAEAAAWEIVASAANDFKATAAFAKKSPFAAVRWQLSEPEVKVGDEWFGLVSLNDLTASEILGFSQKTYGDKCQKRFEEDLVELLTRMGHPPEDTVKLVLQSLTSPETRTLENVPMTEANRNAIYSAALARERGDKQ
jgi:CubicO group peptidase (beta-lactamase class C family)